jgi:D-amino-acid dehydrogenase
MSNTSNPGSIPVRTIAIVGGGVVGAATALALSVKGFQVTLFDPDEIGAGTSSGNAGGIVTGAVLPTATPGVLRSIPSYILDSNGPAVLRPAHAIKVLPWLLRFIAAGRPSRVDAIAAALHPLVSRAMQAHTALADISGARHLIKPVGWLKVYTSDAGFADTALERALMTRHGVNFGAQHAANLRPGARSGQVGVQARFVPTGKWLREFPDGPDAGLFRGGSGARRTACTRGSSGSTNAAGRWHQHPDCRAHTGL